MDRETDVRRRCDRGGRPRSLLLVLVCLGLFAPLAAVAQPPVVTDPVEQEVTQGALRVKGAGGAIVECPLRHTDVKADISGFIARVRVTQTFFNPYEEKIEAVYVFPLPHTAAVDDMTMVIGERRIVGVIKRRAEARAVYEQAVQQGLTASLLEQERPNIFTQSVGNIKPKQQIRIVISYVDVLKYDMGTYEFHFPMVVGPRYIPGAPISKKPETPEELKGKVGEVRAPKEGPEPKGTGWAPDTNRVPDASRITPPVLKPGYRTGHDISLSVQLEAGVPIHDLKIVNHMANVEKTSNSGAVAALPKADSIPNKDFVMRYSVVGKKPEMAVLTHSKGKGQGYFMLMIQPRIEEALAKAPPREIVFLVDVSGSMSGAPTAKVKETMQRFFEMRKPEDTIQLITFASQAAKLFDKPVPATQENIARALGFTANYVSGGGTEMLKGIKMVLEEPVDPQRVRIVVMLTDGYIGNEAEIIQEVGKRAGDQIRFWTLGIGSSPNRFLLDGVAKQGGGASGVIELNTDPTQLVTQIVERIHRAQLAKIAIDWKGLPVFETYPRRIPELWAGRPVILFGRYQDGGKAKIRLSGVAEGKPISYQLDVSLPSGEEPCHDVLAKVWARNKIEDLSAQMFYADVPEVVEEITQVALDYRLMSQYTSFVAVDESEARHPGEPAKPPRRMVVPVPIPEGVSFEGVFGSEAETEPREALVKNLVLKNLVGQAVAPGPATAPAPTVAARPAARAVMQRQQRRVARPASSASFVPVKHSYGGGSGGLGGGGGGGIAAGSGYSLGATLSGGVSTREELERDAVELASGSADRFAVSAFQSLSRQRHEEAKKALLEAQELQKKGKLEAALRRFQHAFLLESAFLFSNPWNDDGTGAAATEALQSLTEEIDKERAKENPALGKKLDLVVRDEALSEALQVLAKAAGLKVVVVRGSLEDAAEMLNVPELRVTYLDLRGATVAQGLDWLLVPVRLSWEMGDKGLITVATARRLSGNSAWVYAIGDLTMPLQRVTGDKAQQDQAAKTLNGFLSGVRLVIGQRDDSGLAPGSAVLLTPDQLLVYGDSEAHEGVAAFLAALTNPGAEMATVGGHAFTGKELAALMELQKAASTRWAGRAEEREKLRAVLARLRLLNTLNSFSWQLLAGAIRGNVDLEALTELQVAWASPEVSKLADAAGRYPAMRSAWAITSALVRVPRNELKALAVKALGVVASRFGSNLKALQEKPEDSAAYLAVLYSVLAVHNAEAFKIEIAADVGEKMVDAEETLLREVKGSRLAAARTVAASLLAPTRESDAGLLKAVRDHKIIGNDLVTLTALAAWQRGGNVWRTFREEQPDLLGGQPLDGNVLLIVNRLAARTDRLLARRPSHERMANGLTL